MFLQNMRNRQLRQYLMTVPGSIRALATAGQEAIAEGLINDFHEFKANDNTDGFRRRNAHQNGGVNKNRQNGQGNFRRGRSTFPNNSPVQGGRAVFTKKLTQEQLNVLGLTAEDDVSDLSKKKEKEN